MNQRTVKNAEAFWKQVNGCAQGQPLAIRYYRDGNLQEATIFPGRERFRQWKTVSAGLPWSSRLDPWPNPGFSLIAAGYEQNRERLDLGTPASQFALAHPASPGGAESREAGLRGREGWRFWLVLFGLGGHTEILSQESAAGELARAEAESGSG